MLASLVPLTLSSHQSSSCTLYHLFPVWELSLLKTQPSPPSSAQNPWYYTSIIHSTWPRGGLPQFLLTGNFRAQVLSTYQSPEHLAFSLPLSLFVCSHQGHTYWGCSAIPDFRIQNWKPWGSFVLQLTKWGQPRKLTDPFQVTEGTLVIECILSWFLAHGSFRGRTFLKLNTFYEFKESAWEWMWLYLALLIF